VSYNGSGTFNINSAGQPVVTGTVIASTPFNALTADLGTGLSTAITKDGQTTTTARIPFAAGINSSLVTDATNTATGSIITAGGVGVAKALFVGTTANIAGTTTFGVTGAAFPGSTSGTATIVAPAVAGTPTITLPIVTGTLATLAGTETLTNKTLTSPVLDTAVTGTAVATQAQQETASATNVLVTPGRQQFHPSAAKVWAKGDFAGAVTVGYNTASVTDGGVGVFTVVFTTAFSNADYAYSVSTRSTSDIWGQGYNAPAAGSCNCAAVRGDRTLQDATTWQFIAFGDQ